MQRLEVSGAVRRIYRSSGFKGLKSLISVVKKIAGSQKRTERNNTSSQLPNCWHTDSQSILLATSSGEGAYDNRFRRPV